MSPFSPKVWKTEDNPLGPPADEPTSTPLTGEAVTAEFQRVADYAAQNVRDRALPAPTSAEDQMSFKWDQASGAWIYYPPADGSAIAGKQDADPDLTAIAGLSPSDNDVIQRKSGAWVKRTPAQLKADLALVRADVGLGSVDNTADLSKPVSAAQQALVDLRAPAIPEELGYKPAKVGKIISKGAPGSWNESYVEALKPFWDPASQRWGGVLVGYDTPFVGGFPSAGAKGKIGLYWSDDLVHWTPDAANPIFAGTGNTADWDGGTLTAPSMHVRDNGDGTYTYVLYYIGVPNYGWEASGAVGQHFKLGFATASSPSGPFTRSGSNPVISNTSGWRGKHIFHRSIVEKAGTFFMFFNASTTGDVESIGFATAPAITGPWTVDDADSPVLSGAGGGGWDNAYCADPSVFQVRDSRWFMAYAGGGAGLNTQMGYAWTTDAEFPLGWRRHTANPFLLADRFYDGHLAGKSAIIHHGGRAYNFYCAKALDDSDFSVALAIGGASPDPTWRVVREKPFNQGGSIPVGKYLLQTNNAILLGGAASATCSFPIKPDDFAFGRAAKLKLRLNVITNAVPPGASYQLHLYKVNAIAGASAVAPAVTALGASPIASTPVVTTPSGDGTSHPAESAEFDCPGDFYYVLVLEMTVGTTAANSRQAVITELLEKAG